MQTIATMIRQHALQRPQSAALVQGETTFTYAELDSLMDRVAAALQRDGVAPGQAVAVMGMTTPWQAVVFLGALRAGVVVAPITTSVTPAQAVAMLSDAEVRFIFIDASATATVPAALHERCIALEHATPGRSLQSWLAPQGAVPDEVPLQPEAPFNIIYSSGTTGTPKGIVQSHGMRATHIERGASYGYSPETRTLVATPLYSNTTLVVFLPTVAYGGTAVLMRKFDAASYLALAQSHRITHTMLVPVQYQRIMALPAFDTFDLSSFQVKFCTSAPFAAALKTDVLARWPGGLVEFYGMTEGGGTCILEAHRRPDKLHTVGQPGEGHDIRLIDDEGVVVAQGQSGEVVGHSSGMMTGYHAQPEKTREAEWYDADGKRFIRTGDVGRFDDEGFLQLIDRKKDMIISGGFNLYPSDLEAELRQHPGVLEAAVVGVPSERWGETPVAFVVLKSEGPLEATPTDAASVMAWLNARVGKMQRVSAVVLLPELPRSPIGKVLKRELRERHLIQC